MLAGGRLLRIITDTDEWGWGALIALRKLGVTPGKAEGPLIGKNEPSPLIAVDQNYVIDILLGVMSDETGIKAYDKDDEKGIVLYFLLFHLLVSYFSTIHFLFYLFIYLFISYMSLITSLFR